MPDINYRKATQQRLQPVFTAEQAELLAEIFAETKQSPQIAGSKTSLPTMDKLKIANRYIAIVLLVVVSSLAVVGLFLYEFMHDKGFSGFDAVLLGESSMLAMSGCLALAIVISRRKALKERIKSSPEQCQ